MSTRCSPASPVARRPTSSTATWPCPRTGHRRRRDRARRPVRERRRAGSPAGRPVPPRAIRHRRAAHPGQRDGAHRGSGDGDCGRRCARHGALSDAAPTRHPLPRRRERPGRQGHALRRPGRRGRPARARRPIRRGGRRRAGLPGHHGRATGTSHAARRGGAHGTPRLHPADRGRRRAVRLGHEGGAARGRRQGRREHGRRGGSGAHPALRAPLRAPVRGRLDRCPRARRRGLGGRRSRRP